MTKLKLTGNYKLLRKTKSGINKKELSLALSEATKCGPGINTQRGFISLPNFNSTTGAKDEFYGIYISDGELVVDTIANVKEGTNPNCGNGDGGGEPQALRLTFDSIENANILVGDASNVADWNTFFDLPTYGNPFTSVEVVGNEVRLFGGSGITIKENTFIYNNNILKVIDSAGSVTSIYTDSFSYCENITEVSFPECLDITGGGYFDAGAFYGLLSLTSIYFPKLIAIDNQCFASCISLTTVDLPSLTTVGSVSFQLCTSLTTVNIPSCTDLGGTVGNDSVFSLIIGNTITLTIPPALMTADSGSPDGDIAYLQANNTVTIITV